MFVYSRADIMSDNNARVELFKLSQLFVFLFAIIFTAISQQPLHTGSAGGAEQWLNVLPEFFTGPQDFLFSYGPLYWLSGSVVAQYSEFFYWVSAIFISLYVSFSWAILLRLAIKHKAVILLAIAYVGIIRFYNVASIYFTLPLFIIIYCRSIGKDNWLDNKLFLFLLSLFVGFLFYFRFFYGMVGLLTFGSYLFSTRLLKRKFFSVIFFTTATFVVCIAFGFMIFRHIGSIIDYVTINSQLNYGNSVDMTYDFALKNSTYVIIFLVFVCFNVFLLKSSPELILTINGLLLIFLKIGFSRADHYINYFVAPVALISLIFAVARERKWVAMSVFVLVLMLILGSISIYPGVRILPGLKSADDFSKSFSHRAAAIYPQFKLPASIVAQIGSHTIDVYPYNNEYLIANNLNYQRRPLFQNYMTLTPRLDSINVAFLEGKNAPEFILWTGSIMCTDIHCDVYEDFDEKYILNEDPLTSTAILSRYHVVNVFADSQNKPLMLLQKNRNDAGVSPHAISRVVVHFGEWIPVPHLPSGVIKLKPELKLTLLAKIQNMLYRGGVLYVNYKLASGEIKRFRLNIINAQSGIWVSPLLNAFPFKGERVVEVMLETPNNLYFNDEFNASWQSYPFENLTISESAIPTFRSEKPIDWKEITTACEASIDSVQLSHITLDGQLKTRLMSTGWGAFSIKLNQPAEEMWLTLTNEKGQRLYAPVSAISRQDVANHFQKSALVNSGYKAVIDVSELKGNFDVGLSIAGEGKLLQCSNFAKAITLP